MTFLTIDLLLLSLILPSCIARGTTSALLPWVPDIEDPPQPMPFTDPPHVRLQFSRDEAGDDEMPTWRFTVDTGSTGIITRAENLNVLRSEPRTPDAYLFLTSSKILYKGFWIDRWVWFNKGTASEVRARVPVLAVEHKCTCFDYVVGQSGAYCAASPYRLGLPNPRAYPCGAYCFGSKTDPNRRCYGWRPEAGPISMMGIGFGRTYNGQEQSTPDKNVLLNVRSIGGRTTTGKAVGTSYSPGWIIDKDGITLGLTDSNWSPFASRTVSLPAPVPEPPPPRHLWPWGEIPGTYAVAGFTPADCNGPSGCGMLIDTGIRYTSARSQQSIPMSVPREPGSLRLQGEHSVSFSLGPIGAPVISEHFTTGSPGDPNPVCSFAPQFVKVSQVSSMVSGYNTGSHILRKYRMAIDFTAGMVGFANAAAAPGAC